MGVDQFLNARHDVGGVVQHCQIAVECEIGQHHESSHPARRPERLGQSDRHGRGSASLTSGHGYDLGAEWARLVDAVWDEFDVFAAAHWSCHRRESRQEVFPSEDLVKPCRRAELWPVAF